MNDNAKAWVAALRSGKFKQGKHMLHDVERDAYCCLGVAAELAKQAGAIEDYFPERSFPPQAVADWMGLTDTGGRYSNGDADALYRDNDRYDLSFEDIADIIESEPKGLFQ